MVSAAFDGKVAAKQVEKVVDVDGKLHVDFETILFDKREFIFGHIDFKEEMIWSRKRPAGCGNEYLIRMDIFNWITKDYVGNSNA